MQTTYRTARTTTAQDLNCPVCSNALGMYDEVFTLDKGDTVTGCTHCHHGHNAYEWFGKEQEEYADSMERRAG